MKTTPTSTFASDGCKRGLEGALATAGRIRIAMLAGFLGLVIATSGVLATTVRSSDRSSLNDHAMQVLARSSDSVAEATKTFVGDARNLALTTRDLLEANVVRGDDATLVGYWLQQLRVRPNVAGGYIGREDGSFVFVTREETGLRSKVIAFGPKGRSVTVSHWTTDLKLRSTENPTNDTFDARTRPWYTAATSSAEYDLQPVWTDPYVFFTSKRLGVTSAVASRQRNGSPRFVVGVDIDLAGLDKFLDHLLINQSRAMIHDGNAVIALPSSRRSEAVIQDRTGGRDLRPRRVDELSDPVLRLLKGADFQPVLAGGGSIADFSVDGQEHLAVRTVLWDRTSPMWTIVIDAPRSALVKTYPGERGRVLRMLILTASSAAFIGTIGAWRFSRRVRRFELDANNDALTGLPMRRELDRLGEALIGKAQENGSLLTIAALDLDGFKQVNDLFGHAAGDEVLKLMTQRIRASIRVGDLLFRRSGDEFVLLFTDTPVAAAHVLAQRLVADISSEPFVSSVGVHHLTLTVGMASTSGRHVGFHQLLAEADHALLRGKSHGRNRVETDPNLQLV